MSRKRTTKPTTGTAPKHIPGVVLAYIHPGQVSGYFTESMLVTYLADVSAADRGVRPRRLVNILQEWSSANVSAARNTVTSRFLDLRTPDGATVGDWLLWIDSDMQWEPDAIEYMMQTADPVSRPIVGGLCFGMATDRLVPTIYQFAQHPTDGLVTVRVEKYPTDSVIQCAATGAAFLLIHRSVLERMRDAKFNAAFPFFQEVQLGDKPVGEDIAFCLRAGQLGIPIHVDTRAKIGHHKSALLTEAKFLAQPEPVEA